MKKIIAILLFSCFTLIARNASAQTAMLPAQDTVTDATTHNLVLRIPGSYNVLTMQLNVTKLTGTTAGTAFIQGSLDGVNYNTVPGTDTLTLANASQSKNWALKRSDFLYYRIRIVGSGTQSTQVNGLTLYR